MATPTDPLYGQQWHLPMLGNIQKIWDDYTGSGVTVAVYDDGVQFTHPDLAANYDASKHFTFAGVTYVPTPISTMSDAHGTACAGLIGAVDNNGVGGTGVAHGVKITGLDYLNDLQYAYDWSWQQTSALYDAAMRWAAGFDIMSNSWGTNPDYSYQLNLNNPGNASAVDAGHFAWVSANGRGGLGTIVVKAAGNETMNANGDGSNVSRHTITVAATEQTGFAADYSNFGSSILITAPAASVTTDLVSSGGYNWTSGSVDGDPLLQTDYTSTFSGTSAATPVVAGVVALMLDANDDLGWRDVQAILAMSASHTGSAVGAAFGGFTEVGTWLTMGGNQWNGGGSMYHLSYGFGMVDAYAAVRMAEVWSRLYGEARTSGNEQVVTQVYTGLSVAIADSNGNSSPEAQIGFAVTQDIEIDSIQVTIDITHSWASDLVIMLRSPTGQLMTLFDREGEGSLLDFGLEWTFAAEAFRGMSSLGNWTLEFHDVLSSFTGRVYDAELKFFGSVNSVNDVYHFTDDFKMLGDLQASRQVIDDINGGTDWLNFAAMTGNLNINMGSNGAIKVNGITLAKMAIGPTDFEFVQAGDGNDVIAGNDRANRIFGERGNDKIEAGKGNDTLYGGDGNDTLSGSTGNDRLWAEAGNDLITGAHGDDTVAGDAGNDTISGGAGFDVFYFGRAFGRDIITDFADNLDTLQIDNALWTGNLSVAQVLSNFGTVSNGSVVLTFGANLVITLQGLTNVNALLDDVLIY